MALLQSGEGKRLYLFAAAPSTAKLTT